MTKFNPENKETLTYGECLGPAMEITDPEDAKQYLDAYTDFIAEWRKKEPVGTDRTPRETALVNIGYYAGYYSPETRERVYKLFNCSHPFLGKNF